MDSSPPVLEGLDPISRALVELSIVQGMDDAEIAATMGSDEDFVANAREDVLREVAARVAPGHAQSDLPELERVVGEAMAPESNGHNGHDAGNGQLAVPPEWADQAAAPARRLRPPLILGALIAAIAAILYFVAFQTSKDETSTTPLPSKPAPQAKAPQAKAANLTPLPGAATKARGTISTKDGTLHVSASNLPAGAYTVWLYNSLIDAKPIATANGKSITIDKKLPAGASRYRYVDVSLEPADGNPNHSGQSVLRAQLKP